MDKVTTFEEYDIDTRTIPYLNKAREKARQLRILKKQKGKEERLRNKTGEDEDVVADDDNEKMSRQKESQVFTKSIGKGSKKSRKFDQTSEERWHLKILNWKNS